MSFNSGGLDATNVQAYEVSEAIVVTAPRSIPTRKMCSAVSRGFSNI